MFSTLLCKADERKAALRLMRKLPKEQGIAPRVMITDKLGSYAAAKNELMPGVEHRSHKGLNNRAENSHLAVRRRERAMKRFNSSRQCQRFVSIHGPIANLFHLPRNLLTSATIATSQRLHGSLEPDHHVDGCMKSAPPPQCVHCRVKATLPYSVTCSSERIMRKISLGASVVIWRTFASTSLRRMASLMSSTRIDRPGVGLDAEVEQARNEREALLFGGNYGIEPEIGEGHAGLATLDVAQEALRIAETWLAGGRQHRS